MKKIIVSTVALALLLTGCAQSKESLYEEVVQLCEQYSRLVNPDTVSTGCADAFSQSSEADLTKTKQSLVELIAEFENK